MLRSTFTGLNMAFLGLNASQKALDVTGQNITNLHTTGYSRQRLDQVAIGPPGPSPYSTVYGARVGQGVLVTGVSQIRDPYLDNRYRAQLSKVGTEDARYAVLEDIGDIFDNVDTNRMQEALDDVVKQMQQLSSKVGTGAEDNLIRSSFEVLLNFIHQNATDLETIRTDLEDKMENTVLKDINEILKGIQEYNVTIRNSQVMGDPALELKDERNLLIDELATYFPINITYDKKMMGSACAVETMSISIEYTDKDGNSQWLKLVEDDEAATLEFKQEEVTQTDENGNPVVDEQGNEVKVMKSYVDVIPAGAVDANGNPDPTQAVKLTDTSIPQGVLKGDLQMLNCYGQFDGSGVKGLGYYETLFNSFVYTMATEMNKLNNQYGFYKKDANGKPVDANGNTITDPEKETAAMDPNWNGDLFESADGKTINAKNIRVSEKWKSGEIQLVTSEELAHGKLDSTANDNLLQMMKLLSTEEIDFKYPTYGGVIYHGNMPNGYANIQAQFGIDSKGTLSVLDSHMQVLENAADNRESVMGVNLDEEVMSLLKYSQAYGACARLMTTMDEALERLINNTGIVGR